MLVCIYHYNFYPLSFCTECYWHGQHHLKFNQNTMIFIQNLFKCICASNVLHFDSEISLFWRILSIIKSLVQVMAWCLLGTKPLLEPVRIHMSSFLWWELNVSKFPFVTYYINSLPPGICSCDLKKNINFEHNLGINIFKYSSKHYTGMNAGGPHWWEVNMPLPEPLLASLGHVELNPISLIIS